MTDLGLRAGVVTVRDPEGHGGVEEWPCIGVPSRNRSVELPGSGESVLLVYVNNRVCGLQGRLGLQDGSTMDV